MQWNPYVVFNGNCEAAFKFYQRCLGGTLVAMVPYGDMPSEGQVPAELSSKIMHARLMVGNQLLMGADAHAAQPYEGVKGCSVALQVETPEEAETVFKALGENGTIVMPLEKTFWALRFGMLIDQYGVPWMINCENPRC